MGAICGLWFSEEVRAKLGLSLAIINWISILGSLGLVLLGAYGKMKVQPFVELMDTYDDDTVPYLLIGVGLAFAIIQLFGGIVCYLNGDPNNRPKQKILFLPYMILTGIMLVCTFVAAIMCFVHIQHLSQSFAGGLKASMEKYRDHKLAKSLVDKLQMAYSCCGSETYTEWFNIAWINEDYLDTSSSDVKQHMSTGAYKSDDVPFSCCNPQADRPCIHQAVHNDAKHFNYDYQTKTTLNTMGCKEALMGYFGTRLSQAGGIIFGVFLLQVAVFIMVRFLQTSVYNAIKDPNAPSQAWLIYYTSSQSAPQPPPRVDEFNAGDDEYMIPTGEHYGSPKQYQSFSDYHGPQHSHHTYAEIDDDFDHYERHQQHQSPQTYDRLRRSRRGSQKYSKQSMGSVPDFTAPPPPGGPVDSPDPDYEEISDH